MTEPIAAPLPSARPELRFQYVDCRFGQLHVTIDGGAPEDAPPLIMMNTRPRSLWKVLPLLRPHFRGVILDIPGSGNSSPPPQGSSMSDIAGCVVDYLDAAGLDSAPVFGFQTGNKVATAVASYFPDRVAKLIIFGKSHSFPPDSAERNVSMREYLDRLSVDTEVLMIEGKFVDDGGHQQRAFKAMFAANFEFDFGGALAAVPAETLVVEVLSELDLKTYGLQGEKLVAPMTNGRTVTAPEIDPTGIDLYIGAERTASLILEFLR